MKGQSDLGKLIQRIDDENRAAQWALSAPNLGTAKHRFITRRMESIGRAHAQLGQLVGEHEATKLLVERLERG